jgi:flagellar hook-length control protein FliK
MKTMPETSKALPSVTGVQPVDALKETKTGDFLANQGRHESPQRTKVTLAGPSLNPAESQKQITPTNLEIDVVSVAVGENTSRDDKSVPAHFPGVAAPVEANSQSVSISPSPQNAVRQVVQHLDRSFSSLANSPIEITLAPEELGKVRMQFLSNDGTLVLHIAVERAETLDLFKRNGGLLERELSQFGYNDIVYSFSEQSSRRDDQAQLPKTQTAEGDVDDRRSATDEHQSSQTTTRGLDIKL